ncbi:MAG: hypothetical protein WB767_16660 [Nocardioides sp.]
MTTTTLPRKAGASSPRIVRSAAALLALTALVSTFGTVMFGFVWGDNEIGSGLVFTAFAIATAVTAVAALPSLLRGSSLAWAVTLGWTCSFAYWSVYKAFVEEEVVSGVLLAAALVVAFLLTRPAARAHALNHRSSTAE